MYVHARTHLEKTREGVVLCFGVRTRKIDIWRPHQFCTCTNKKGGLVLLRYTHAYVLTPPTTRMSQVTASHTWRITSGPIMTLFSYFFCVQRQISHITTSRTYHIITHVTCHSITRMSHHLKNVTSSRMSHATASSHTSHHHHACVF